MYPLANRNKKDFSQMTIAKSTSELFDLLEKVLIV